MFWKSKPKFKLPETASELNYRMEFLQKSLPELQLETVNIFSFQHSFPKELTKDEAKALFLVIKNHMNLSDENIQLDFFWEAPLEDKKPTEFLDTSELYKTERLTIGQYLDQDGEFTVKLGMTTLKDTNKLIFALAHELAHYILLGKEQLVFNDEKLTDMLAMVHGFGNYWLRSQDWKTYFTVEQIGYLSKGEGLFIIGRIFSGTTQELEAKNIPKSAIAILKEAIETSKNYTESTVPYTEKVIKASFGQAIINSIQNTSSDPMVDSKLLSKLMTYNDYVKKGRAATLLKKRPDIGKAVLYFLDLQKKWITQEETFLHKTGTRLKMVLESESFAPIEELLQKWQTMLTHCQEQTKRQYANYEKYSYVQPEGVIGISTTFKSAKIKDMHAYATREFDLNELNLPKQRKE